MRKISNVTHREGRAHPYTWTVMRGLEMQEKSVTILKLVLVKARTKIRIVVMSTWTKMGTMLLNKIIKNFLLKLKGEERTQRRERRVRGGRKKGVGREFPCGSSARGALL